ncbi:GrpE, mitochondrial [Teratosphaeriaceae sp. CCFEE 6253]|nr:GrpE, mitochondrial [Teratosphaeriaceae sp. CCFEE 6253]
MRRYSRLSAHSLRTFSMIQRSLLRSLESATRSQSLHLARRSYTTPFNASRTLSPTTSRQLQGRRWYSEAAAEAKKETVEDQADAQGLGDKATSAAKDDAKQKELEAKNKEVIDLKDRLLRQVADYRNLQEQTKREVQAGRDFALQRFSKDLLDSIDNLDRALGGVEAGKLEGAQANADLVSLHSGLRMVETILMATLKKHGMERFDPAETAEQFDPNKMEATFQAPQQGKEDGSVFYTQQKGFTLNGRVLRAAKVGIVKNS